MTRKKFIAATAIALVAIWFLGVDWSWFVHDCPDCGYGKDVGQYRLFTIPILETTHVFPSITQQVAADLGAPCLHRNSTSWHQHRWWGLCFCKGPCINGVYRLADDDAWYDNDASAKVAALAIRDKSIAHEFVHNVLEKHEFDFVQTVLERAGVELESAEERMTK